MDTKQQIQKLRNYLLGQIYSAIANNQNDICTYFKNGGKHIGNGIYRGEICQPPQIRSSLDGKDADIYMVFIDPETDEAKYQLLQDNSIETVIGSLKSLTVDDLENIVHWLTENGFISRPADPVISINERVMDFLEQFLPEYNTLYGIFRQGELQELIDGHDHRDIGLNREEAIAERDRLLFLACLQAIEVFGNGNKMWNSPDVALEYKEVLAEVGYLLGSYDFRDSNPRDTITRIITWTDEFFNKQLFTDWNIEDYIDTIHQFVQNKIKTI